MSGNGLILLDLKKKESNQAFCIFELSIKSVKRNIIDCPIIIEDGLKQPFRQHEGRNGNDKIIISNKNFN